jgi:flagellar assembly protein FliH
MATLIRSVRIAERRRLLDGGADSQSKPTVPLEQSVKTPPVKNELDMRREAELRTLTQARAELEEALQSSQQDHGKTEAELRRMKHEVEAIRQDAVEAGRESGYRDGQQQAMGELRQKMQQLDRLFKALEQTRTDQLLAAEADLAEVVFASVTKILGEALTNPEAVIGVVRQVIKQLVSRDHLVIHLSAEDKQLLERLSDKQLKHAFGEVVELVADPRVELGGCLVQTSSGGLDGRLEIQMKKFRDCLIDVAARREAEGGS